ncbi:MAG: EAL domain-containing protein [Desulfuromonadaceae bacterium]|nr:EAL domain-containing protein [Desulfuromonadaceae bacterium]MDD5106127.1 EAL domain-containing protein [Desulfuromonadaceae bacterium]
MVCDERTGGRPVGEGKTTEAHGGIFGLPRRAHDFGLSIDNYGTCYASMRQLTRIAFTELRFYQSFVNDFATNQALCIIVKSSIEMAHKLRGKSVAEGAGLGYLEYHGMRYCTGLLYCQADVVSFVEFCGDYHG